VGWYFWRTNRAAATNAEPASIAVLPFADLSPAKDQDWMCDGIAEEIIDALCTVTGLRVAARSSSFQFKGKTADVRAMTAALGVSTLLEGSVRKLGDRLRVSARLVSSDGYELWSDRFDRGVQDAFAIQEEIARAVVAKLRLRISSDEAGRLRRSGTANPQAYESFQRAIALGPGLRDAWYSYARFLFSAKRDADAAHAFEESARRNPDDYDALMLVAMPYQRMGQPANARAATKRALDAADRVLANGPDDVRALYLSGGALIQLGERQKGIDRLEQAAALKPHDYGVLQRGLQLRPRRQPGKGPRLARPRGGHGTWLSRLDRARPGSRLVARSAALPADRRSPATVKGAGASRARRGTPARDRTRPWRMDRAGSA
jgi:TolB-like protein/Tfp pilus assembly protein PilF